MIRNRWNLLIIIISLMNWGVIWADNLQEADKLFGTKNYAFANKLYLQILQENPMHPEKERISLQMALCQFELKNYNQAESMANSFLRAYSISAYRHRVVFLLADIELARGNKVSAMRKYYKAIKRYPKTPEAFEARIKVAQIYMDLDRVEEAEKIYSDEIKKNPKPDDLIRLYYHMGLMYESKGDQNQALLSFKKAVMTVTTNIQITANSQYRIADILLKTSQYEESLTRIKQISTSFPQFFDKDDLLYRMAYNLQMLGRWNEGLTQYESIKSKDTNVQSQVGLRIIEIWLAQGETNKALKKIEELESNPGINDKIKRSVIEKKVQIHYERGELDQALRLVNATSNKEFALLLKAQIYFQQNMFDKSLESLLAYENEFSDQPNMDKVLFLISKISMSTKQYDQALPRLRTIYERYPASPYWEPALYSLGICQKYLGKLDDALITLNRVVSLAKDKSLLADAQHEIAMVYYQKQRYKEAADQYTLLAKNYPDRKGIFLFNTGESYLRMGYTNAAMDQFKASLTDPTSQPALNDIYGRIKDLLQGQRKYSELQRLTRHSLTNGIKSDLMVQTLLTTSYEQGYWKEYLQDYLRFSGSISDPGIRIRVQLYYARYLYGNRLYGNAIELYQNLISESSTANLISGEAYYELGMCYLNINDLENAQVAFDRASKDAELSSAVKIDILNQLALYHYKNRNYPKARFYFSNLSLNFPNEPGKIQTLYWIGMCYYYEAKLEEALSYFERAQKEDPQSPLMDQLLQRTGDVYFDLGNFPQAALSYKKIIDQYPKSGAYIPAKQKLAITYERIGNSEEAGRIQSSFGGTNISSNPALFPSYYQMALLQIRNGDFEQALSILVVLETNQFQLPDVLYQQATLLRMLERYDQAAELYIKIIYNKFESTLAESMYYLAFCYEQSGQKEKALEYYNRTQTNFPGTSWASMALIKARKIKER